MMRYEYSTVEWHKEEEVMGCESLSQILNRKGGSGWIFCTSIARELVFMRPLSAETKDAVQVLAEARRNAKQGCFVAGGVTGGQLMEMTQEQRDKLKVEIEAAKTPEPFKAGSGLPFNNKYPVTGILDAEGRGPNKRVYDVLTGRNIMNVGQLVEMNPNELDGLKNCGLGTKLKILAMREWARGKLLWVLM